MTAQVVSYWYSSQSAGTTVLPWSGFSPVVSGDVLIVVDAGNYTVGESQHHTAVEGLGATWTKVTSATQQTWSVWVGVGGSGTGDITATGGPTLGVDSYRLLFAWHLRDVTASVAAQKATVASGTATTPSQVAGPGQVVLGHGYSDTDAGGISAVSPTTGWTELASAALYSTTRWLGAAHRAPSASAGHTVSANRPGGLANALTLVVGTSAAPSVSLSATLPRKSAAFTVSVPDAPAPTASLAATLRAKDAPFGLRADVPSAYEAAVLADSPTYYFRLSDPAGSPTAADSSGNGYDATYYADPPQWVTPTPVPGLTGDSDTAASVDQLGATFDATAPHPMTSTAFSVEFIVAPTRDDWAALVWRSGIFEVVAEDDGFYVMVMTTAPSGDDSWRLKGVDLSVAVGERAHVAVTYDGATLAVYRNGVAIALEPGPGVYGTFVGPTDSSTPTVFRGEAVTLDEVAYYNNVALSASQVAAHADQLPALGTLAGVLRPKTSAMTLHSEPSMALTGTLRGKVAAFGAYAILGTDKTNRVGGRSRSGYGHAEWSPAVVAVPSGLDRGHAVVSAHAYGAVTMRGAQPTFTVSEASKPRDRQRILIGGHDVTFFRGAPTPEVPYQLADPLLWGPATIELPQVAAAFEKPGTRPLRWLRFGAKVVIQRVNEAGVVTATDYRGVVIAFGANGGALTVECGGQAQGRAAMRDWQVPIFQQVGDLGGYAWTAIRSLGLQFKPRMGPETGVELGRVGGMGHLDYIRDLCARAQTKAGKRWTIMPNEAGVYRMTEKDTTTVHATIFCDDARAVANLRRDMAEEPNRIYATGVTPNGQRVRFGVYPGLRHGDAPPFPNAGGRVITEGHTNADTDSGDGISVLAARLRHTGYLSADNAPGGYDRHMTRAVRHLQADADLAETGNVNTATWDALFDLNATGYSLRFSRIEPAAQRSRVRQYQRSASGAVVGMNPNYDRQALKVDRSVDIGSGFERSQMREWARNELADSALPNWVGTIEVRTGAVLAGQVAVGATVSTANVMDVRDLRPGMNVWLPQFDGGTLLHISGIDVRDDSVTLTVDTRARDALEVWEVITRNRETRANPSRAWRGNKASTEIKDSIDIWDEVGGFLDVDVPLVAGWNIVRLVSGQAGTVADIRLELKDAAEFACAVFGERITVKRLNHLIEHPLTKAGTEKWEKRAVRKVLEDRGILYSAGTKDEPCGYSPGRKTNDEGKRSDHPLRGVHRDDAGFSYLTPPGRPILYVAVWVGSANTLKRGRIMWPQLEAAV